jgi:hypothetical protein
MATDGCSGRAVGALRQSGRMAHEIQVTFDCTDPGELAAFWCAALDYQIQPPPPGFSDWDAFLDTQGVPPERRNDASACIDPEGQGPRLFFQRVPEPKTAKNRVHLDVRGAPGLEGDARMAALEELAGRLVERGATRVQRFEPGGMSHGHIVMQDPEGNEFCLD